ncbi:MAG: pilin [Patescibacteria group bacterium]
MKHSRKILAQLITLVFSMSLVASTAAPTLAAVPKFPGFGPITKDQAKNLGLREETNLIDVVISITKIVLTLASVVALLFIIIAGIRYVTSSGDEKHAEQAKKAIIYAVIGLIVIGVAAAIVNFTVFAIRGK